MPADALTKGLVNVGVGAAVAGGMNATAKVVKRSPVPLAVKLLTVIAGGAVGGALVVSANAVNSMSQRSINSSAGTSSIGSSMSSVYE